MERKKVRPFGNGGHITLPKTMINKQVVVLDRKEFNLYSKNQKELEEDVSDFELNEAAKKKIKRTLEDLDLI